MLGSNVSAVTRDWQSFTTLSVAKLTLFEHRKYGLMQVTVVRPDELGPSERQLWLTYQQLSLATLSPYMSFTFVQTVGRYRSSARVAVIEHGGVIQAFLPFEISAQKIAIPIGHPINDLQGFVGLDIPIDARSIIRKAGLRGWRFDHAPASQENLIPHHHHGTMVRAPVIDISHGYQSYVDSHNRPGTKRIAEKQRSLQRRLGSISLVWRSSDEEHLRQLITWKSGKYGGTQRLFSEEPNALHIVRDLAASDREDCAGVVSLLYAGEQAVAIHLGLLGPMGLYSWMPSYDLELSRFSPGLLIWMPLIEEAAARDISRIDLGYGQHSYKFDLANDSYSVVGGAVWASKTERRIRKLYRQLYYDRRTVREQARNSKPTTPDAGTQGNSRTLLKGIRR
jgi:CelD/BcsL family acetyltransferase involved in cellulose biosynthesis